MDVVDPLHILTAGLWRIWYSFCGCHGSILFRLLGNDMLVTVLWML